MKMKLLVAAVIVSSAVSCKIIDKLRTFTMDYSVNFTVPSSSVLNLPISLPTSPTVTNSEQRFEDEGVESAWVESVKMKSLVLTITSPQGEDFSFLNEISLYMKTDDLAEVLIADKIPVSENAGNMIALDVKGVDLYPYISQDNFTLRTSVTTDETTTQSVDFRADMVMEVKATIPGGK